LRTIVVCEQKYIDKEGGGSFSSQSTRGGAKTKPRKNRLVRRKKEGRKDKLTPPKRSFPVFGDTLFNCHLVPFRSLFRRVPQNNRNMNSRASTVGTQVYINVYDLAPANDYLVPLGLGLHHSGVEISGTEYSFASGAGIFEETPRQAPGARFRQQVDLGSFTGGSATLKQALAAVREDFGPDDYNLVRKNCNHFAAALSWKLLGKSIPSHINRLADLGVCCSCLLPRSLLEHAPVGDPQSKEGGASGFLVKPGRHAASAVAPAFGGTGNRLGAPAAASGWTSQSRNKDAGDLTDRREKARKAALARLEQNQQSDGSSS
jgi:hypothetical protein